MTDPTVRVWMSEPPVAFVAGSGPYALALAQTFGISAVSLDSLPSGPAPNSKGADRKVLDNLKWVFLVVPDDLSAADALRCRCDIWKWVEKLASAGDQHDLAFVFVLPTNASKGYEEALAVGLGLPVIDSATSGHAVLRRSCSLPELLELMASLRPMDLVSLRACQDKDVRQMALKKLLAAVVADDQPAGIKAVTAVLTAFSGFEYLLDVFCRPPRHQHGDFLRKWLQFSVSLPVTPDWWVVGKKQLVEWLDLERR